MTKGPVTRLWREAREQRGCPTRPRSGGRRGGPASASCAWTRARTVRSIKRAWRSIWAALEGLRRQRSARARSAAPASAAMVAISGDLAFSDAPPARGWRIGLHDPRRQPVFQRSSN